MENQDSSVKAPSLKERMIKGSIWMIVMRWSIRGIGLISTLILARLLTPDDFGVVAMGMLVVGLMETITAVGVEAALLRTTDTTDKHFNTAWTFRLLQAIFVASVLFLSAEYVADYFDDERVVLVIQILAAGILLGGFENIGVVEFRKKLQFSKDFKFEVIKKISTFVITLTLAFTLESYWALIAGIVCGKLFGVVYSYLLHPYRPKFSFSKGKELWGFSQWMLAINIGQFANRKIDEIVIGGNFDTATMGTYSVSSEISAMPTTEVIMPLSRALLPGYAQLAKEPERINAAFVNVLSFVLLFSIPAAYGVGLVAEDLVHVLLGEKWIEAIPFIKWLAVLGAAAAIISIVTNLLIVFKKEKMLALLGWINVILITPALFFAAEQGGVEGVAMTRVAFILVFTATIFYILIRITGIPISTIISISWRTCIASICMGIAIQGLDVFQIENHFLSLLIDAVVGAITFSLSALILWILCKKPSSAERTIVEFVFSKIKKSH